MGQKVLVLPPPCPKPPAVFLSPPCPLVISLIPLFLPQGRMPAGVRERVISKQLRVGHIYLSLGAGPFFQPLSSPPNVPIARAPPSQFPSFLGVIIKEKKKKKSQCPGGHLQGAGDQCQAALCQPCPRPPGHRTSQSLRCLLTMHFYECSSYRCF